MRRTDGISAWAMGVCCCAVMVSIAEVLVSDTGMERMIRAVLGGVMVCAVLVPLGGVISGLGAELPKADGSIGINADNSITEIEMDYLEETIEDVVRSALGEEGITAKDIKVKMDIDEENRISMITAEVMLGREDAGKTGEVSKVLKERLNIGCRTVIG